MKIIDFFSPAAASSVSRQVCQQARFATLTFFPLGKTAKGHSRRTMSE
jgi:hypothetical protein